MHVFLYLFLFAQAQFSIEFFFGAAIIVIAFVLIAILDHSNGWDPVWLLVKKTWNYAKDHRYTHWHATYMYDYTCCSNMYCNRIPVACNIVVIVKMLYLKMQVQWIQDGSVLEYDGLNIVCTDTWLNLLKWDQSTSNEKIVYISLCIA